MPVLSESVWFEQVDKALLEHISKTIVLPNSNGILAPLPVKVRKPDEDFKIEEYPCITLYNLYSVRDEIRYFPDKVIIERDAKNHRLIEEKSAVPYNLFYQLDFWSKMQSQMNNITRLWAGNHPDRSFVLPVRDVSGNLRDCLVMITDEIRKADVLSSTERTFHSVLTLKVWVELDERIRNDNYLITEIPHPETTKI